MTIGEGIRIDHFDGFGQCDGGQMNRSFERTLSDGDDGIGHRVFGTLVAQSVLNQCGLVLIEQHAIDRTEIRIIGCHLNSRQDGAVTEGFFFDGGHRVRYLDGDDIVAAIESASSDGSDTGFDDHRFNLIFRPRNRIGSFVRSVICHRSFAGNGEHTVAGQLICNLAIIVPVSAFAFVDDAVVPDIGEFAPSGSLFVCLYRSFRHIDRNIFVHFVETVIAFAAIGRRNGIAGNRGQTGAIIEPVPADAFEVFGDSDRTHAGTVLERIFSNAIDTVWNDIGVGA